jgi:NADH dehydrogenase
MRKTPASFRPFERSQRTRVVVVGAGFAGIAAARRLAGRRPGGRELEILVVDRQNYHLFAPLLYQVAAAEITPEQIAYPIRSIFRNDPDVQALAAEVQGIDREERILQTNRGPVPYDWLVIATGSKTHWFGVPGAAEFSYGLKSLDDARELRNHVLACVERAASEQDPETRKRLLSFVIVGGGPTGVEFAGALAVLFRGPLPKDYPELDLRSEARIVLAEAGPRPLPGMSESASREAVKRLEKLGVEVRCGAMVEEIAARHVQIRGGESILADTTVWTAGVQGDPQARNWGLKSEKGRVLVEPSLLALGEERIFVLGDLACLAPPYAAPEGQDGQGPAPWPMVAPVAMQQGKHCAKSILRILSGKHTRHAGTELPAFRYKDPGYMCALGRNRAVADVLGLHLKGFTAWVLWVFVHIGQLVGFRNRVFVLAQWAWNYIFFQRATRMILPQRRPSPSLETSSTANKRSPVGAGRANSTDG